MLQYLVTSKVRRRLLVLLWGEMKRGSVSELASAAGVAFSNAHAELKSMQQHELVRSQREERGEVYFANREHPHAALLEKLASTDSHGLNTPSDEASELKGKLVALGAPLRGVPPVEVAEDEVVATLLSAVELARRDPVVARSLPVCLWKHRARFDAKTLKTLSLSPEDKHAFAFLLELAGDLGGDQRLAGRAEVLRDERLTQLRPFFRGSAARGAPPRFDLANKWGFVLNMDRESFRGLFSKFVTT
ncbi:MAG TPA: winged helix-turn-helix domain-containing protein [Gemmatimonadaceae bacterium]|nr:winged helix-turn-helix domain-containing protein [Gemmatimonadaceae bacterium]